MNNPPAPDPLPQVSNKQPTWKVSPSDGKYFVNSVAVSANAKRVVGGTFYHEYRPGETRRTPVVPPAPAGNQPLAVQPTFGTYCYDATGQLLWKDEFQGWQGVYWVALSADGSRAAAGGFMSATGQQGFVSAYNAAQGRSMLLQKTQKRVNQVALSGDGTWLVSAAETLLLFRAGLPSANQQYTQAAEFSSPGAESIVSAAISQDGSTVVYSDFGGWIGVLANNNGTLTPLVQWKVPPLSKEGNFCHMIDLAPDGKTFAAGGAGGRFYYFDVKQFVATQQPTSSCATGVEGAVYGVAVAETGGLFAGVVNRGEEGTTYLARLPNGSLTQEMPLLRNPNSAALNAKHRMFAVADGHPDGSPGHFYLFELGTTALRWRYQTGNMSWPIVIAANGSAVVGGSDDSYIYYFTP